MTAAEVIATLIQARKNRRLGQDRVAVRLGKCGRSVLRWERGHCSPSLEATAAWAEALGYRLALVPAGPEPDGQEPAP
ncbi:helix-turn-helix transcriptional regulator [Actinomadura sp. WMMA1423]|uniref:helix-turn-helix transcriptional regulator n=1 Tax=Actinomadura sp. WMMA1423 TaxID=2591108 RepID=UPI001146F44E|nr:helix-turn-helix transcriptional regulator [Actinomadura sp. WMMA1423]